jgi:hypothetical protein
VDGAWRVVARTACTETKVFPGFPAPSNLAFVRALARVARCFVWWRVARSRGLRRVGCGGVAPALGYGDLVRDHVVQAVLLEARIHACRRACVVRCRAGRGFGRRGRVSCPPRLCLAVSCEARFYAALFTRCLGDCAVSSWIWYGEGAA